MRKLTHFIVVWLMLLAIPMQGFASAAPHSCGANLTGVASTEAAWTPTAYAHSGAHPPAHHEHTLVAMPSMATEAFTALPSAPTDAVKMGQLPDSKCSVCAVCCTGSALLSATLLSPVVTMGSHVIPFPLVFFLSHVPEGFDPPPRPLLA